MFGAFCSPIQDLPAGGHARPKPGRGGGAKDLPPTDDHLLYGYAAWPVSELLARLLIDRSLGRSEADSEASIPDVRQQAVLEVGAGVGLAGLACSALGARE
ncbi:unnamed protein product, partial [Prorocentrum cordatum]